MGLERKDVHMFGGCPRLLGHYRCVGDALLAYEADYGGFKSLLKFRLNSGYGKSSKTAGKPFFTPAALAFRESVSFVPDEVLESYLEDLLDLDVSEEKLFIANHNSSLPGFWVAVFGFSFALIGGSIALACGAGPLLSLFLVSLIAIPFLLLWNLVPHSRLARRVAFAKLVSREIARRRGTGRGASAKNLESKIMTSLIPSAARELAT